MNRDLMLAVLSMHAYSDDRNFNQIGNAVVAVRAEETSGFYANAYTYNGEIIISYRGTDGYYVGDAWYGWGGGAGFQTTQAELAAEFYNNVVGDAAFPFSTNVTFTGHSLGGGLAGLMAGLYGKSAVVFDNMAYGTAIQTTYGNATQPYVIDSTTGVVVVGEDNPFYQATLDTYYGTTTPIAPDTSGIRGFQLQGQILQGSQSTGAIMGSGVDWGVGPVGLHSQALLVLTMFAGQQGGIDPAWKDLAQYLGPALLGLADDGATNIAYSVVDEGARPFGDAAARSMFDDAADISKFETLTSSAYWQISNIQSPAGSPYSPLALIAVSFALHQANTAVRLGETGESGGGVFHSADAGLFLALGTGASMPAWDTVKTYVKATLEGEMENILSDAAKDAMNGVVFALFSDGGSVDLSVSDNNPLNEVGQMTGENAFVFGTTEVDNIIGGAGNDFLLGGDGADVLIGGDGKDALFGGAGADVLVAGRIRGDNPQGSAQVTEEVVGGAGSDYIVVTSEDGAKISIESGDKDDRLLIHESVLDSSITADGNKIPMFALLGGVFGTHVSWERSFPAPTTQEIQDVNLLIDSESGLPFRMYFYEEKPFIDPETILEAELPFRIAYLHFFSVNELVVVVDTGGDEPKLTIKIKDYNAGDYGIELDGPIIFYTHSFLDDISSSFQLTLHQDAIAEYNAAVQTLLDKSDDYSLTEDGTFVLARALVDVAAIEPANTVRVVLTGDDSDDVLAGNDVAETYYGGLGNDVLRGAGGDDRMFAEDGNDRLIGGQGADELNGGKGVDTADYRTSAAGVVVSLVDGTGLGGDAEGDTLFGIENLAGSQLADELTGDAGVNRLQGFAGADHLSGGDGNDRLLGGAGADVLNGGNGVDTADYSTSESGVVVDLNANLGTSGDAEGDSFISIENLSGSDFADTLVGDGNVNRLTGGLGNDMLNGLGGNDYLVGSEGSDTMTGGAGADVFVFNAGFGVDTITDFWIGVGRTDRVQLIGLGVSSFTDVQSLFSQTAGGVVLSLNGGADQILFAGIQSSALLADDFVFA